MPTRSGKRFGRGNGSESGMAAGIPISKSTPGFFRQEAELWSIHGRYYDMSSFVSRHPGGEEMIVLGRGRDCTELFESVHCLSKLSMHKILAKYEVPTPEGGYPPPEDHFSWEAGGFYDTLVGRVRKHFADYTTDNNYKATWAYWVKVIFLFATWAALVYAAFDSQVVAASVAAAFFAGIFMNSIGFCVMHDGSHYAISFRPWINRELHGWWSDWNLWSHFLWLRHHVYGHHSYTGIWKKDPDLRNSNVFVRKHESNKFKTHYFWQHWAVWPLLGFWPGQHLGQSLMYLTGVFYNNVFGVPLGSIPKFELLKTLCFYALSIYCHFVLPFQLIESTRHALALVVAYWVAMGFGYFVNIVPNHDTFSTHVTSTWGEKQAAGKKQDWGIQQVLNSGNHTTDKGLWSSFCTTFWGGMNYQIEHHLFPSVSHVHFAAISLHVEQTCKEFDVPYTTHSWFSALWQFGQLLAKLSENTRKEKSFDWRMPVTMVFAISWGVLAWYLLF